MKYTLRDINEEDFSFWCKIDKKNFKKYYRELKNNEYVKNFIKNKMENRLLIKKIIIVEGKRVGVYVFHFEPNKVFFINELNILKKYQNKGIGKSIIKEQLEENHNRGMMTLLTVFKTNNAIEFYKKMGFVVYDDRENHYILKHI